MPTDDTLNTALGDAFGPLGIVIGVLLTIIASGGGIIIKALWSRLKEKEAYITEADRDTREILSNLTHALDKIADKMDNNHGTVVEKLTTEINRVLDRLNA